MTGKARQSLAILVLIVLSAFAQALVTTGASADNNGPSDGSGVPGSDWGWGN